MDSTQQIKNFALNIALWQVENSGFHHKISVHIQDVVLGFVITKLCIDNGVLSFDGMMHDPKRGIWIDNQNIPASKLTEDQFTKILNILKDIDLFK